MKVAVNECYNRMWSDKYHRVGANLVKGWMRADTPELLTTYPWPVDVPFSAAIPAGLSDITFHGVCTDMFCKIQNGELLLGLDYTPPPPAPVQAQTNWGGAPILGLLGLAFVGIVAGSRN